MINIFSIFSRTFVSFSVNYKLLTVLKILIGIDPPNFRSIDFPLKYKYANLTDESCLKLLEYKGKTLAGLNSPITM